jgi:LPS export ABC transporter protein LptC
MKLLQLLVVCYFLVFFCSCEEGEKLAVSQLDDASETLPDQISWDVTVDFIDSSFKKAVLTARKALIYEKRKETVLDSGLKVVFFSSKTGKRASVLTADSAKIDDITKDMMAMGNVIVISDSNQTKLETELLMWKNRDEKLYSTEFVRITSPDEKLQGYGFESDLNLTNYKIFKVSGETK